MKPSSSSVGVCTLLLVVASLQLLVVAVAPTETKTTATAPAMPDEEFLARLCDQHQGATRRRLPWCQQLHARRRHGGGGGVGVGKRRRVPMPPPSRAGEEIDARYGVSKRVVPSGPNPLHN
uniref:CLAVATA3/ESR-like protein n=1 Tax=Oryza meridionalis TaxID=40149 RepID=A0A0E0C838_9ORYZ